MLMTMILLLKTPLLLLLTLSGSQTELTGTYTITQHLIVCKHVTKPIVI